MVGNKPWTTQEDAELIAAIVIQVLNGADSVEFQNSIYPHLREAEITRGDYARAEARMKQAGVDRDSNAIRSHFSAWKNKCKTRTGEDVPKNFKGQSKYESENKNKKRKRKRIIESDEEGKEEDELNNETVRSKKSSRKNSTEKGKGGLGLIVEKDDEDEDEDEDEIKGFSVDGNEAGMMKKRGGNDDEDDDSPSHVEGGVCLGKIWFVARGSPSGAPSLK